MCKGISSPVDEKQRDLYTDLIIFAEGNCCYIINFCIEKRA